MRVDGLRGRGAVIYVSGAPGNVGTELVRLLSNRGEQVCALIHHSGAAQHLQFPGVETVVGDLAQPSSFAHTLVGADAVFINSERGSIFLQKNLIDAAAQAGVRLLVNLSWMGASEDSASQTIGRGHAEVERHLHDSGLSSTVLRASAFMQNYLGQITTYDRIYGTTATGESSLVDARDVATVAATVLTEQGHEGRQYHVTGPQALSNPAVAGIISTVTGRDVHYTQLSPELLADGYHRGGLPEWLAFDLVTAEAYRAAGHLSEVTDVVERVGGKKPMTFEAFVREFAAAQGPAPAKPASH
jgi:uncharacterized protein YbjT (DUF2867 family)